MNIVLMIVGAAVMLWTVWQFISGLGSVEPLESDAEALSRSYGTWNS